MDFVTFNKYKSQKEALNLIDLLNANGIEYLLDDIAPAYDISITGGTALVDKVALKIHPDNFVKVNRLLEDIALNDLEFINKDHYLYNFSNEELIDILANFDEWSKTDYLLAKKILQEKDIKFTDEEIQNFRIKKIEQLKQAVSGRKTWIIIGFMTAIIGGVLGIWMGIHYYNFKKRIVTGERVYAYDNNTRKLGKRMFTIGIITHLIIIFGFVFYVLLK